VGRRSASALGHEQTSRQVRLMSLIPLKVDVHRRGLHVRLVPLADIAPRQTRSLFRHQSAVVVTQKTPMACVSGGAGQVRGEPAGRLHLELII
jgi:hypothetical protein